MADSPLVAWQVYYTVLGTASAALIGLLFVVITIVNNLGPERQITGDGLSTFSTPTLVHFGSVLALSAALCAPWQSAAGPALALAVAGLVGLAQTLQAVLRVPRMEVYRPDLSDWVWHWTLPGIAYLGICASAVLVWLALGAGSYVAAWSALGLVAIGIRNSWDVVTYVAVNER